MEKLIYHSSLQSSIAMSYCLSSSSRMAKTETKAKPWEDFIDEEGSVWKSDFHRKSVRGAKECAVKMKETFTDYLRFKKNAVDISKTLATFEDKREAKDRVIKIREQYDRKYKEFANILSVPGYHELGYDEFPDDDQDGVKLADLRSILNKLAIWPQLRSRNDDIIQKSLDDTFKAFEKVWPR